MDGANMKNLKCTFTEFLLTLIIK